MLLLKTNRILRIIVTHFLLIIIIEKQSFVQVILIKNDFIQGCIRTWASTTANLANDPSCTIQSKKGIPNLK